MNIVEVEKRLPYDLWQKVAVLWKNGKTIITSNLLTKEDERRLKKCLEGEPIISDEDVYKRYERLRRKLEVMKKKWIMRAYNIYPFTCPKCGNKMNIEISGCQAIAKCPGCCYEFVLFLWC